MTKFAIVKCAGSNIGKVRSVHRSFDVAQKNWPVFYKLVSVTGAVRVGEVRPELLEAA
jgi:hypothetical protein